MALDLKFNEKQTQWESVQDAFDKSNTLRNDLIDQVETGVAGFRERDIAGIDAVANNRMQTVKNNIDSLSPEELLSLNLENQREDLFDLGGLGGTQKTFEEAFAELEQYRKDRISSIPKEQSDVAKVEQNLKAIQNVDLKEWLVENDKWDPTDKAGMQDTLDELPDEIQGLVNDTSLEMLYQEADDEIGGLAAINKAQEQNNIVALNTAEGNLEAATENLKLLAGENLDGTGGLFKTEGLDFQINDLSEQLQDTEQYVSTIHNYARDPEIEKTIKEEDLIGSDTTTVKQKLEGKGLNPIEVAKFLFFEWNSEKKRLRTPKERAAFFLEQEEAINTTFSHTSPSTYTKRVGDGAAGRLHKEFAVDAIEELDKQMDILVRKDPRYKIYSGEKALAEYQADVKAKKIKRGDILTYVGKDGKNVHVGGLTDAAKNELNALKLKRQEWKDNPPPIKKDSKLFDNMSKAFLVNKDGTYKSPKQREEFIMELTSSEQNKKRDEYVNLRTRYYDQLKSDLYKAKFDALSKYKAKVSGEVKRLQFANSEVFQSDRERKNTLDLEDVIISSDKK
jgi:hypothetical protein